MPPSRPHLTARHEIIGLGEISMGQRRIVWEMERLRIIGKTEKEVYLVRRIGVGVMRVLIRCLFQRNVISQLQGFRWHNVVHFVHNSLAVCTARFIIALSRKAREPRAPCGQKSGTHISRIQMKVQPRRGQLEMSAAFSAHRDPEARPGLLSQEYP
jgi:hypothetical protein